MENFKNRKIILASTSPRRIELFKKIVSDFEIVASDYEEDMTLDMPPSELVQYLAKGKAEAVAEKYDDAVVIGGDTFIAFDGKVLGKPHTVDRARVMLKMLSGNTHSVFTGIAIVDTKNKKTITKSVECKITFKSLSDKEIDDYIATGEPLSRAGAYAIQTIGKTFTTKIDGDYDTIVGLPVDALREELLKF